MKLFGTIFPFVEPNSESQRMGRFVANYEFLTALLNFGDFDSYHLFCMNPQHLQATADQLMLETSVDPARKNKIHLFLYSSLQDKLASETYHVFHLGGWGYFFAGLAQLRNRYATANFPITGVIHSLNAREARFDYYKLLSEPIASCDAVVCTSRAGQMVMEKQLSRIALLENRPPFPGHLPCIPLGVNDHPLPDPASSRNTLNLDSDTTTLLYIGRISPNSKADLYPLLFCFKQLLGVSQQPLQLIIAGGASSHQQSMHREMISEMALEDAVTFLPNFDPKLKWQLYAAADICVAPSDNLQETFGIAVIEAMLAGLPVVASELNGYRDLIEDGENGFLVNTTWIDELQVAEMDEIMATDSLQTLLAQSLAIDLEQLQARLQTLIDNPPLRQAMGAAARQKALAHYTWPTVIQQYLNLWQQLYQEAEQCEFTAGQDRLFGNDYLQTFSHYPSRILDRGQAVALTRTGRQCLESGQTPPIYSDVAMLLDQDWLNAVMQALVATASIPVGELLSRFGDQGNRGRFSLMWGIKYGLLQLK